MARNTRSIPSPPPRKDDDPAPRPEPVVYTPMNPNPAAVWQPAQITNIPDDSDLETDEIRRLDAVIATLTGKQRILGEIIRDLKRETWAEAGSPAGGLCVGCAETRLRRLSLLDFRPGGGEFRPHRQEPEAVQANIQRAALGALTNH